MHSKIVLPLALVLAIAVSVPALATPTNFALNPSGVGLPSPLESDAGLS